MLKLLKCLPGVIRKAKVAADDMFQQSCRWLLGELQDHFTLFDRGQCHQLKSLKVQLHNQQRLGKIIKSLTLVSHASQPITFYLDTPARNLVLLAKMPLRTAACHDLERVLPAAWGKLISFLFNFYLPRTT